VPGFCTFIIQDNYSYCRRSTTNCYRFRLTTTNFKTPIMEVLSSYTGLSIEEMLQHSSLLINALDQEHRILFWNKKSEDLFGISKEAAIGKRLEELLPELSKSEKMEYLQKALAGYSLILFNQHYGWKNGAYSQRLIPIRDAEKNVIAVLNIVEDLPE
jgi:PAS domain S-box-containing protein